MKTSAIFVAAALAVSVSAQNFQQNNRNNNLGGARGGFGNNQNNGFFGQNNNGRNGQQNNQNQAGNKAGQGNNNNNNKAQTTSKAATATAKAVTTSAAVTSAAVTSAAVTSAATAAQTSATAVTGTGTGAAGGNSADPQKSTTLDPKVIATGFANNGQDIPTAGQVASLTSTNNFINFCLTVPNLPITNGKQITTGSCNPAPMGIIPSTANMPSSKFTIPKNGDSFVENTPFTITMAVSNFQTGAFVNAAENYFAAPQQLNAQGQIIGHSHVVVEQLTALDQTTTTDPKKFAFFKGLNAAAVNGLLTADVTAGLPAGFYKVSSINTAANHQPVLVPVAQHGSLDDVVYFTVTASGANATTGAGTATGATPPAASSVVATAPAASSAAAVSNAGSAANAAASASSAAGKPVINPAPVRGTAAAPPKQNTNANQQKTTAQTQGNKSQQNNGRNRRHARAFAQL